MVGGLENGDQFHNEIATSVTIAREGNGLGMWLVYHMILSLSLCYNGCHCIEIGNPVGFYFVVLCSQAGEGASEEGCGADEASGPKLQTRSSGFTGKCKMGTKLERITFLVVLFANFAMCFLVAFPWRQSAGKDFGHMCHFVPLHRVYNCVPLKSPSCRWRHLWKCSVINSRMAIPSYRQVK